MGPLAQWRWLRAFKNSWIDQRTESVLRLCLFPLVRAGEQAIFGGSLRQRLLISLLTGYYRSAFRRSWMWYSKSEPHFFDHQVDFFNLTFLDNPPPAYTFYRAFYNSELIRAGDVILDLGCGDGFFTKRFFSERATRVDAIDLEPDAILAAEKYNSAANVSYYLQDAVTIPFPDAKPGAYDMIIWDGALGHFPPDANKLMLNKIQRGLQPSGVFVGSESLGSHEGRDHLQFFETLEELAVLFRDHFECVYVTSKDYKIASTGDIRREAYWRCSNRPDRLREVGWKKM